MRSGNGHIIINKINYKQYYLNNIFLINKMLYPFVLTNTLNKFDLNINVYGGGHKGQIDAICLAISKSLVKINVDYKKILRANHLLTRDCRIVESKKFGRKKARKKFQFSKR